ncbi:MAG: DUF523 domain-containing protein [Clostridia bacterium]|nr:DUF523 domain-containing protein [Clostridia bacterium]
MENVLISACLLGVACRYDGRSKPLDERVLAELRAHCHLIPICPEIMGGLPTPRIASEVGHDRRVVRRDGADVTAEYQRGAEEALRLARFFECRLAILKARSPACGSGEIYDGTFTGTRIAADGIAAALLKKNGVRVLTEEDILRTPIDKLLNS